MERREQHALAGDDAVTEQVASCGVCSSDALAAAVNGTSAAAAA
jgi:hypothetical protein